VSASIDSIDVKFFDYPRFFSSNRQEYLRILDEVLSRGAFILQKDVEQFERNLASFIGVKHAIGTSDATNGLTVGLRALGVGPGDEVVFPSHTFIATAGAIKAVGAEPIPADMGTDGLISDASIREKISRRTKAILPVQLNGRVCNMDPLVQIAKEHGLLLVEDAAQALGARFKGRCAGTFGSFGAFSFYPAKSLGCFGDGGAVVTDDDDLAAKIRLMRDHGRSPVHGVEMWGMNTRLDNVQAAILDFKLKSFDAEIARRRAIAVRYTSAFEGIDDLTLPPPPDSDLDHFDTFQNYEIRAGRRDALREFLLERGIQTIVQWGGKAVHQFEKLGFSARLPSTDAYFERCFLLPMNTLLTDAQVEHICETVRTFYGLSKTEPARRASR
jgi:dTDP-4-amino-4,6-dideoxygalactose transaminase